MKIEASWDIEGFLLWISNVQKLWKLKNWNLKSNFKTKRISKPNFINAARELLQKKCFIVIPNVSLIGGNPY